MFELTFEMVRDYPWGYEPRPGKKYYEVSGVCKHCRMLEDRQDGCSKEDMAKQLGIRDGEIIMSVHDGPGCRVLVEMELEPKIEQPELNRRLMEAIALLKVEGRRDLALAIQQATGVSPKENGLVVAIQQIAEALTKLKR